MSIQELLAAANSGTPPDGDQPWYFPPRNSKVVYTVKDLLEVLRVSRPTIYKLLTDGDLPSSKVGARRLVTHEDLMVFLRSRRIPV